MKADAEAEDDRLRHQTLELIYTLRRASGLDAPQEQRNFD